MNEQEKIRFNYTPLDDGSYEVKQGALPDGAVKPLALAMGSVKKSNIHEIKT